MKCEICKKTELEFEREGKYMFKNKQICQDCYCKKLGDFVEKNQIFNPERI
jgi:hypothetical protein